MSTIRKPGGGGARTRPGGGPGGKARGATERRHHVPVASSSSLDGHCATDAAEGSMVLPPPSVVLPSQSLSLSLSSKYAALNDRDDAARRPRDGLTGCGGGLPPATLASGTNANPPACAWCDPQHGQWLSGLGSSVHVFAGLNRGASTDNKSCDPDGGSMRRMCSAPNPSWSAYK